MRVFVTGASGWIGSALVAELMAAGHQVLGLVRSDDAAAALSATGAEVRQGSMEDLECLRGGALEADGVVHTAFNHDFSKHAENCELDRRAIEALGAALEGSHRPLLVTSGLALQATGRVFTENDLPVSASPAYPRVSEITAIALAARGINAAVVRLPPSVHGHGDHGFIPMLVAIARAKGLSAYVGNGLNRWPAVHRLDAAQLFRLALEKGVAGAKYHGVADEGVPFKEIAAIIGRRLDVPVVAKPSAEAAEHFGWMAQFAAMDLPASAAATQNLLGWHPTRPGLIADIDHPSYFAT